MVPRATRLLLRKCNVSVMLILVLVQPGPKLLTSNVVDVGRVVTYVSVVNVV